MTIYDRLKDDNYVNIGGGYLIVKIGTRYVIFKDNEPITKPMIMRSLKAFFNDIAIEPLDNWVC